MNVLTGHLTPSVGLVGERSLVQSVTQVAQAEPKTKHST